LQLNYSLLFFILNGLVFCQVGEQINLFVAFFGLAEAGRTGNSVKTDLKLSLAAFVAIASNLIFTCG
jgi:hypothetical protein